MSEIMPPWFDIEQQVKTHAWLNKGRPGYCCTCGADPRETDPACAGGHVHCRCWYIAKGRDASEAKIQAELRLLES